LKFSTFAMYDNWKIEKRKRMYSKLERKNVKSSLLDYGWIFNLRPEPRYKKEKIKWENHHQVLIIKKDKFVLYENQYVKPCISHNRRCQLGRYATERVRGREEECLIWIERWKVMGNKRITKIWKGERDGGGEGKFFRTYLCMVLGTHLRKDTL